MKPSSQFSIFNFHFITFSFSFAVNTTSAHLCSHDQSHALLHFKNSFTINSNASIDSYSGACSSSHPRTNSWQEGRDCCYWDGVSCDTTTGHVIGIDLSCSWLQGQLSSNNSLFLLQHLETLNLAFNDFSSSVISPKLSQFQRLRSLNLSYSNFYGEVPIDISYLSNLVALDLTFSYGLRLTRGTMTSLVQNLTMLKELNLDSVDVSTVEPESLRNISSSLTSLTLSGLKGIFPTSIFHLPNLQLLHLYGDMDLQVSLPTYNWSTTSLTNLQFRSLNLKNGLPSSIRDLKSLKYLDISRCGNGTGLIPNSIGNVTRLVHLSLSDNYLVGNIPPSLADLTNLEYLDLSENELVGSIPKFSNLSSLDNVNLYANSLTGTIPLSLYSLPLLRILNVLNNQFTGGKLHPFQSTALEAIDLHNCGLQGPIPVILFPHGANQLTSLNLFNNSLNGTIPSSLLTLPSLLSLDLSYNQLVGGIPKFKSTSLQQIDLSQNKLQGNILSSISGLATLTTLYFSSNNFTGTIDTSMFSKLQSLTDLDGSNNNLSFPTNVNLNHSLPNLRSFVFSFNNLTDFPIFLRDSKNLSYLDLSNNKIDGYVTNWLGDVGRDTLRYLNLSHNNLFGHIPSSIENLRSLQWLDLSSNKLDGTIPIEFASLTFLVELNLSQNALVGTIPSTYHFDTKFDNNSYQGNLALCGPPLSKKCGTEKSPPVLHEEDDSDDFDKKSVLYGFVFGLAIGLSIGHIIFSYELPVWLAIMVHRYRLRMLRGRTQQPQRRN